MDEQSVRFAFDGVSLAAQRQLMCQGHGCYRNMSDRRSLASLKASSLPVRRRPQSSTPKRLARTLKASREIGRFCSPYKIANANIVSVWGVEQRSGVCFRRRASAVGTGLAWRVLSEPKRTQSFSDGSCCVVVFVRRLPHCERTPPVSLVASWLPFSNHANSRFLNVTYERFQVEPRNATHPPRRRPCSPSRCGGLSPTPSGSTAVEDRRVSRGR